MNYLFLPLIIISLLFLIILIAILIAGNIAKDSKTSILDVFFILTLLVTFLLAIVGSKEVLYL